ncbi:hypothetical protein ACR3K2_31640 [Cryptosporidium serpentis]
MKLTKITYNLGRVHLYLKLGLFTLYIINIKSIFCTNYEKATNFEKNTKSEKTTDFIATYGVPWIVNSNMKVYDESQQELSDLLYLEEYKYDSYDQKDTEISHFNSINKNKHDNFSVLKRLKSIRKDLLDNWAFNIKYGSLKIQKETFWRVLGKVSTTYSKIYPNYWNPPRNYSECWGQVEKLALDRAIELYSRKFTISEILETKHKSSDNKLGNIEEDGTAYDESTMTTSASESGKFTISNSDKIKNLFIPINTLATNKSDVNINEKVYRDFIINTIDDIPSLDSAITQTCEMYMNIVLNIYKHVNDLGDYDFAYISKNKMMYNKWLYLYQISPNKSLWDIFLQLITFRGDLSIYGLSNGDTPILPSQKRMFLPENAPDFFEFTTIPEQCSNNLLALSMNPNFKIRLGVSKIPKIVHLGRFVRYVETTSTQRYISMNLCIKAIKVLEMYQAYYYGQINEYRPDPYSSFYWQIPNWSSLGGYVSYIPLDSSVIQPRRDQFVWCLLWCSTEYARTYSHYRANPIKLEADILHIPMRIPNIDLKGNIETCVIIMKSFWEVGILTINKNKYRPLLLNSSKEVLADHATLHYICGIILKCRTTFHRAYLKEYQAHLINEEVEMMYDTQDPSSVFSYINSRSLTLKLPHLKSIKKAKTIIYGIISTILLGSVAGSLIVHFSVTPNFVPDSSIHHNTLARI